MTAFGTRRLAVCELARQPVEHDLVLGRILGVRAVLRVAGAAREIRALGMHARQRAIRNAVAVDVEIAVEFLELVDFFLRQHLAAIGHVVVVPFQIGAHPVVHADVEIRHHHDRRLQPLGQVEGIAREVEALLGIAREQADVLGVAVRGVGRFQDVALLRARRHAGGRARRAGCRTAPRALRRNTRGPGIRSSARCPGRWSAVKARAPFQLAPSTMPMAASSSSAWMKAKFFLPVSGSTRSLSANAL